jgi:hypothetical protein
VDAALMRREGDKVSQTQQRPKQHGRKQHARNTTH